jgi:hypothetical protein
MRKLLYSLLFFGLALPAPANAAGLLSIPITTAVTSQVSQTFQLRAGPGSGVTPSSMAVQANATGSGGTNMTFWLQTSFDGGITWCDALAGVVTPAVPRIAGVVLSSPSAGAAPAACTDGTATPPFVQNGVYSNLWRVKYSSTGTWTLGNLKIDAFGNGITPYP